ncbi:hypothetical protein [Litorisediminicola beolgyonensis]|uniref:Uncharacterized protein n=1 Tax=Litorisediminicola beolgyonensis TaxID=1173614 RepID=A0ABW3ZHH5_9RHOB
MLAEVVNERLKYLAGLCNGLALGFIGFSLIRPLTDGDSPAWRYVAGGFALHALGHYILGMLREENTDVA